MEIRTLAPDGGQVQQLLAQSDALMASLYPAPSNHLDDAAALSAPNVLFVGAFIDSTLAGCGAVKILRDDGLYGEIKRLFVSPPIGAGGFPGPSWIFWSSTCTTLGYPWPGWKPASSNPRRWRCIESSAMRSAAPLAPTGRTP